MQGVYALLAHTHARKSRGPSKHDGSPAPGWQAHVKREPCQPTTGVEYWEIPNRLRVTEIGSAVAGLWPHYISSCTGGLLYFVDVTAKAHVSFAAMELHSVLAHQHFMVCFDACCSLTPAPRTACAPLLT